MLQNEAGIMSQGALSASKELLARCGYTATDGIPHRTIMSVTAPQLLQQQLFRKPKDILKNQMTPTHE